MQVEFVDPDAPDDGMDRAPADAGSGLTAPGLGSTILQPTGTRAERDLLVKRASAMQVALEAQPWEELRDSLAMQMAAADFWDKPERHRVLARFALMDRVRAAAHTARSLLDRYERSAKGAAGHSSAAGHYSKDLATRLASQLYLVDHGIRDVLSDAPIEVVIAVEPAMESGDDDRATRDWCQQVFRMYCEWAGARRMHCTRVQDVRVDLPLLVISGFGSHSVLSEETGLHVLESEAGGRTGAVANRAVARVRVASLPIDPSDATPAFSSLTKLLDAHPATSFVVRRYRFEPSPLVRDARRGWRAGRVTDVMSGNFDLFATELPR